MDWTRWMDDIKIRFECLWMFHEEITLKTVYLQNETKI